MLTMQVMACMGIIIGLFLLLGINLTDFTGNIFKRLLDGPKGIREEILEQTQRKKKSFLRREVEEIQSILKATDRENTFPFLCTVSLVLFAVGAAGAAMLGNFFLVPVAAVFCVFLTFSIGLFLLLAGLLRLPTLKTSRVMMDTGKEGKQLSKTLDAFYMDGAVKIAKYIRMNDYKKNRMANVLRASGLGMTPEVYTAYAYLKAGSVFLLIIPALYVFPLAALFVILLGIMIYYKEIQKADEMLKEKREQIEEELYRFVSTITQELKNSRDVLSMLEHYKENAGAAFRKELDIVCADMRSSSYEAALTRFEARLNSPQLSDVVRGLIGVLRGDDGAVYFQMLTHDFKQTEFQRLKAKAAKIPPKIRVYSFAMLMCFLATYFAIIIYEIIRSMGTLF